jgi:hypothetical protein
LFTLAILQPLLIGTHQSPIATPEAALTSPLAPPSPTETDDRLQTAPATSPVIWILGGLALGGLIILVVQRSSPADDR